MDEKTRDELADFIASKLAAVAERAISGMSFPEETIAAMKDVSAILAAIEEATTQTWTPGSAQGRPRGGTMDENARERLQNRLRGYLLDVADHVVEYGCIGTVLVNEVADKAMAAIDEATAETWTPVDPNHMPPEGEPVLVSWGEPADALVAATSLASGHVRWWTTGRECWGPRYWMPMPAPPKEVACSQV